MDKEKVASRSAKRRKKNNSRGWLFLLIFLLFIGTVGASYVLFSLLNPSVKQQNRVHEDKPVKTLMSLKDKTTLMIMGVDRRDDDVGRSDTLMVATIDPNKNTAALISVPRDTRVKISGHGYEKINHAYAYGGHTLSRRSVEGLLGVPMEHYVLVDIRAFERIIDALGGVDINVEKRMYYEDPWDDDGGLVIDLRPGLQHMDGETAIQYVRYRDEDGDIGRIARQQKFMQAVMDKLATPSILLKLPAIIKEINSAVETDLSFNDMLGMVNIVRDVQAHGVKMDMVPGRPAYINDISYWLPDLVELRRMVAKTLEVRVDERLVETMQQEASEYESSIPDEMVIVKDTKSIPDRIRNNDDLDLTKVKRAKDLKDGDQDAQDDESDADDEVKDKVKKKSDKVKSNEAALESDAKDKKAAEGKKAVEQSVKAAEEKQSDEAVSSAAEPAVGEVADVNPSTPAAPARPNKK